MRKAVLEQPFEKSGSSEGVRRSWETRRQKGKYNQRAKEVRDVANASLTWGDDAHDYYKKLRDSGKSHEEAFSQMNTAGEKRARSRIGREPLRPLSEFLHKALTKRSYKRMREEASKRQALDETAKESKPVKFTADKIAYRDRSSEFPELLGTIADQKDAKDKVVRKKHVGTIAGFLDENPADRRKRLAIFDAERKKLANEKKESWQVGGSHPHTAHRRKGFFKGFKWSSKATQEALAESRKEKSEKPLTEEEMNKIKEFGWNGEWYSKNPGMARRDIREREEYQAEEAKEKVRTENDARLQKERQIKYGMAEKEKPQAEAKNESYSELPPIRVRKDKRTLADVAKQLLKKQTEKKESDKSEHVTQAEQRKESWQVGGSHPHIARRRKSLPQTVKDAMKWSKNKDAGVIPRKRRPIYEVHPEGKPMRVAGAGVKPTLGDRILSTAKRLHPEKGKFEPPKVGGTPSKAEKDFDKIREWQKEKK